MANDYPKKILIMPDYAPDAYAWDYDSRDCLGPINEYFPSDSVLVELDVALSKWCDWFDRSCTINGGDPNFPWKDFNEQGVVLAKRLALCLKVYGVEVYYQFPYEAPEGSAAKAFRVYE